LEEVRSWLCCSDFKYTASVE